MTRTITALLIAVFISFTAAAQEQPNRTKMLKDVEGYLNSLTTAEGTFKQTTSSGGYATGRIYLSRPGKMLFDYDPPNNIQLIADGRSFIFYDEDLGQVSYLSLDSSIAGILIKENLSFSDESIKVEDVSVVDGNIRIALSQAKDPLAGKIILTFAQRPMRLLKWQVIDAQNVATGVVLGDMKYGGEIDKKLFVFQNPRVGGDYPDSRRR